MQVLLILQAAVPPASYTNPGKLFHFLVSSSIPTIRPTAALNIADSMMNAGGGGMAQIRGD